MEGFPDYYMFRTAEGYGGAIGKRGAVDRPHPADLHRRSIRIEDALAAAERTGGTIKEPKQRDPGHGPVRGRDGPRGHRGRALAAASAGARPTAGYRRVRLVDSHCHLNADRFAGDDGEPSSDRARAAGVERILVPAGTSRRPSGRSSSSIASTGSTPPSASIRTTRRRSTTRAGAGSSSWPPTRASSRSARPASTTTACSRRSRTSSPTCAGTSRWRSRPGKPAILHCRSAAGRADAQDALARRAAAAGFGGPGRPPRSGRPAARGDPLVLGLRRLRAPGARPRARDLVLRASRSGPARRPSAEVVALVPPDRLLVETDSPFLSPPGAPRGRNEPEWVRITAAWVAQAPRGARGCRSATASSPPTTRSSGGSPA